MHIVVLGDLHFPWSHDKSLEKALEYIGKHKPTHVVQIGDLYDLFSFSKFSRTHDLCTPKEEINEGRSKAVKLWERIRRESKAYCYQLIGNHDSRISKRMFEKHPEVASLLSIDALWKFPGVTTLPSERDELFLENICFMHGFRSRLGDHMRYNQMPTVCGHSHQGGAVYGKLKGRTIWELNAGYLGDPESLPLSYTRQRQISNWTLGFGVIDDRGPRFCPL